jgi:hypothetical protein
MYNWTSDAMFNNYCMYKAFGISNRECGIWLTFTLHVGFIINFIAYLQNLRLTRRYIYKDEV